MEQNEPTATEKLREKIAQKFLEYDFDRHGIKYGVLADEILALFEEWAKEAGYVMGKPNTERGSIATKLPDVIGTTLDGQPLVKQAGGK